MIKKLTTIIVLSIVTVNALFLAGVSLISYKVFVNFTTDDVSETRLALINESTGKVSNFMANMSDAGIYIATNRTVIKTFSNDPLTTDDGVRDQGLLYNAILEQRRLSEIVSDVVSIKRGIHSIELYTDHYGHYPGVVSIFSPLEALEEEPWFAIFDKMDSGWVPKHEARTGGQEFISYMHRLMNAQGETVGYVKVNVRAETFFEYLSEDEIFYESREPLLLVDPMGRVIAQSHTADGLGAIGEIAVPASGSQPYRLLRDPYIGKFNDFQILKHKNSSYLMLTSDWSYERWRLIQLIPMDALYAETRNIGWLVIALGVGGLLLSIPLSYWIGRKIITPIQKIIQAMKYVEVGDFDVRVQPHFIHEYNILANKFNRMTYQLHVLVQRLEAESQAKREAEIRTLQTQIIPHFLYNTLDVIHWRATDHQAQDISLMVNQLSKMLRIGLSGGNKFIPLRDELEHARCYINIQRAQQSRHIRYEASVPPAMKGWYVPKIIIQPFVENSMRHGYPKKGDGDIHIRVSAKTIVEQGQERLEIWIADNGEGLPKDWGPENSNGIGIKNVQERIWMYCGDQYGIHLSNRDEGGTQVCIRLPAMKKGSELQRQSGEDKSEMTG